MALGDVMRGEPRPQGVEASRGVGGVVDGRGTTVACDSRNTNLLGLRFRAILDDGIRDVRFELPTSKTRWATDGEPVYTEAQ